MAFGVLYDFTGNSNVSRVIKAAALVKESWFLDAVNYKDPIDLFIVTGHNPTRPTASGSTFGTLYKTIRGLRPDIPIQWFGGHSHIRDFVVFDGFSTGIESGKDFSLSQCNPRGGNKRLSSLHILGLTYCRSVLRNPRMGFHERHQFDELQRQRETSRGPESHHESRQGRNIDWLS